MFSLDFEVRDYECDLQGIVNNSSYLNYLEHTRHKFLIARELNFVDFALKGINLVVAKININYKKPLKPNDKFCSTLEVLKASKVKVEFKQQLIKNNIIYVDANIIVVATDDSGKLIKIPPQALTKIIN